MGPAPTMEGIRPARATDASRLRASLARALTDDPFVDWLVGRRGPHARERYVRLMLRLTLPYGAVYTSDEALGGALWTPPGRWETSVWEQVRMLPRVAGIVGVRRLMPVAEGSERVERARPTGPSFHLALLGTVPEARGRGLGSALLAPVLTRCDASGVDATLETSAEQNVRWYGRRGFTLVSRVELPDGGPTVFCMRRTPNASRAG